MRVFKQYMERTPAQQRDDVSDGCGTAGSCAAALHSSNRSARMWDHLSALAERAQSATHPVPNVEESLNRAWQVRPNVCQQGHLCTIISIL